MTASYTPPYRITPAILHSIEQIGEALGNLRAGSDSAVVPVLRRGNHIKNVQASLAIEGNTLSIEQVTAVISGKRVLAQPREIQEVRNAFAAYEKLPDWTAHSCADLLAAHGLLMVGLVDETGRFRSGGVGIQRGGEVIHIAPPPGRVPALMDDLLAWLEKTDEHPLVASCVFHYEFEFIHPFEDGNGRLGRLWQTLILSHWRPIFALLPVEGNRDRRAYRPRQRRSLGRKGGEIMTATYTPPYRITPAILRAIEESALASDQESDQVMRLIHALRKSQRSASDLMTELGLSHRPTFRKNYLHPALEVGLIEMTQPGTPRARNQKYRLTALGMQRLNREDV